MKHFGIIYLTTQTELSLKILCYSHIRNVCQMDFVFKR